MNGGGTDDSMVDLSEDVTEVCQEESTPAGPGSSNEQNCRLAEAFVSVSASARQGGEEDAVKTQASRSARTSTISR